MLTEIDGSIFWLISGDNVVNREIYTFFIGNRKEWWPCWNYNVANTFLWVKVRRSFAKWLLTARTINNNSKMHFFSAISRSKYPLRCVVNTFVFLGNVNFLLSFLANCKCIRITTTLLTAVYLRASTRKLPDSNALLFFFLFFFFLCTLE